MLNHIQRRPSRLVSIYRRFIPSLSWPVMDSALGADPLTVIEASLTSVKYAFYQVLGHKTLRPFEYHCRNATTMTSASYGLIGGVILTAPYLILLPVNSQVREDFGSIQQHVIVLGKEMMFSGIGGGIGMLVLGGEGWGVFGGVIQGLLGPFVSFILLHVALKIVLWSVWIFKSKRPEGTMAR